MTVVREPAILRGDVSRTTMSNPNPTIEDKVAEVARLELELEDMRHEKEMARAVAARRARDCARLEREINALRAERDSFRRQFEERNQLLGMVMQSGSFRLMQVLRRLLGRE